MTDTQQQTTETTETKEVQVQGLDGLELDNDETITLISKDEKSFDVNTLNATISILVKTSRDADKDATEVPIPGVDGDILELIVQYMNHHKGTDPDIIEKPLRSKVLKEVCNDPWDAQFIDDIGEDRQKLYDLILAANYMDVKSLLHLGCAKVASLIKGQPLEKIKDILAKGTKSENKSDEKVSA